MRLIFRNMLLFLFLRPCFVSIQAQVSDKTDTNVTLTLVNIETVEATVSSENAPLDTEGTSAVTHVRELAKKLETAFHTESTQVYLMSTNLKESTAETTVQLSTGTEQMTTVSESTTAPEEHTTKALETSTTTVTESITSDSLSSTNLQETTVGLTTSDLATSVHQQHEITTGTVAMTSGSTEAPDPTTITSQQPADWTESPSIWSSNVDTTFLDATTINSTTPVISTSQSINRPPELHHSTSGYNSVSTLFTTSITGGNVGQSKISSTQTSWLLIVIVCAVVVCALCMGILLIALQRRKKASGKFGPGYMNGQSKRSKKKKGAENDAWAGPVHLEAAENVDCDGEVNQTLMSDDGNIDGEDMVLSTFTAPEAGETPDGGVGGEGTKEAKKWEEQEPLLYIDEDVKEDSMGKTVAGNEKQKVKENQEKPADKENVLNGGEAFCLTTAV